MNNKSLHNYDQHAMYINNYFPLNSICNVAGLKSHRARFQNNLLGSNYALEYFNNLGMNKRNIENEQAVLEYLSPAGKVLLSYSHSKNTSSSGTIHLPKSLPLKMAFDDVIKQRRSIRYFTGDNIPITYVATLLQLSAGITTIKNSEINTDKNNSIKYRSYPSAGGLYSVQLYILAVNVEKLKKSLYQYIPVENSLLELRKNLNVNNIIECFSVSEEQITLKRSCLITFLVGNPLKSVCKYGSMGVGFTIHELGSISQNIHLTATALGIGSVDCASFYMNELNDFLGLDGLYQRVLHTVIIGIYE